MSLKIKIGSYYKTRDGDIVGPMMENLQRNHTYPFVSPNGDTYMESGRFDVTIPYGFDLVEEVFVSSQDHILTKREQFAIAALQGILASTTSIAVAGTTGLTTIAIKQADNLLEELAKENK